MSKAKYTIITAEEAKNRIDTEQDIIILDVRTKEEFNESHIPSAVNIPLDVVTDKVDKIYSKNTKIFIYCRSGVRSKYASSYLAEMGFTNIFEFGGIITWPYEKV